MKQQKRPGRQNRPGLFCCLVTTLSGMTANAPKNDVAISLFGEMDLDGQPIVTHIVMTFGGWKRKVLWGGGSAVCGLISPKQAGEYLRQLGATRTGEWTKEIKRSRFCVTAPYRTDSYIYLGRSESERAWAAAQRVVAGV